MKHKLSFAFHKHLSSSELAQFGINVLTRMKDHPKFASIRTPLLDTDLNNAVNRYNLALQEAADGAKSKISDKRKAQKALSDLLYKIAQQVNFIAEDDETLILETGFDVLRPALAHGGDLGQVQGVKVSQASASADVVLTFDRVPNAVMYIVEYSTDEGQHWLNGIHTSAARAAIKGLLPLHDTLFRVVALGWKQRRGAPSEPVRFFVR